MYSLISKRSRVKDDRSRDFRWQDCRQENQPLIEYCGCIFNG